MKSASREKIALVLFVAVIALVILCFAAYLIVGHKWNEAATTIDDATGDMAGYTTILYAGTAVPDFVDMTDSGAQARPAVPVKLIAQDYRHKKSSVLVLDALNPDAYKSARVVVCNHRRFGVVSFQSGQSVTSMRKQVSALRARGAECVIALAPYKKLVDDVDDLDIVINLNSVPAPGTARSAHSLDTISRRSSNFFGDQKAHVFGSSPAGTVKAIILSPSNVVSVRVIESR